MPRCATLARSAWTAALAVAALCHGGHALAQAASATGGAVPGNAARASVTVGTGAGAVTTLPAPINSAMPPGTGTAPTTDAGARYVESCQQAIERGIVSPGCQGPLYANEIARLKEDALRTNNPNLLTLLGDAYQSNRTGVSDIGQAYRWYLLGAVRGDPRAMQRLSELYKGGTGVPQDNIKALGYARLAQRLAAPGSTSARQATETIGKLGGDMAAEEVVLAERFASELETNLRSQAGGAAGATPGNSPAPVTTNNAPRNVFPSSRLPGMGAIPPVEPGAAAPAAPVPGAPLPGRESLSPR